MQKSGSNSRLRRGESVKNKRNKDDEEKSKIKTSQNPSISSSLTKKPKSLKKDDEIHQRSTYSQLGYQVKKNLSRTTSYKHDDFSSSQQKQPKTPTFQSYTSNVARKKTSDPQSSSRLFVSNSVSNQKGSKTNTRSKTKTSLIQSNGYDILIGNQHLKEEKKNQSSINSRPGTSTYQNHLTPRTSKKQEVQNVHNKITKFEKNELNKNENTQRQIAKDKAMSYQKPKSKSIYETKFESINDQKPKDKSSKIHKSKEEPVTNHKIKNELKIEKESNNKQIDDQKNKNHHLNDKELAHVQFSVKEKTNEPKNDKEIGNEPENKTYEFKNSIETKVEQNDEKETNSKQESNKETENEHKNDIKMDEKQTDNIETKNLPPKNKEETKVEFKENHQKSDEQIDSEEFKNDQKTNTKLIDKQEHKNEKHYIKENNNIQSDEDLIVADKNHDQPQKIMKTTYTPDFNPIFINQRPPLTEIPDGAVSIDFDIFQQAMMNIQKSILSLQKKFDDKICSIQKKIAMLEFSIEELHK